MGQFYLAIRASVIVIVIEHFDDVDSFQDLELGFEQSITRRRYAFLVYSNSVPGLL